ADPGSTGQIMQFRVVAATSPDPTTPAEFLELPQIKPLPVENSVRRLALLEQMSTHWDGPAAAMLGTIDEMGMAMHKMWSDPVTENPNVGDTEVWEFYNFTADAHPIHIHEITFEVIERQSFTFVEDAMGMVMNVEKIGTPRDPEVWESGRKDTVVAYPGEVTLVKAKFDKPGTFVWHCHIVEHEDNEMMRPYRIGLEDPDAPQ
ncbi:MAG TPA: multicopper oxidase domain-containing protein, partial [Syntrophorhabdaceae bacterium]|nr:multicopper oxidase domain-containing protein [Syntrophorhabdaceae bacterium]